VALRYRLTNTGNAVDSCSVRGTGRAGWPAGPARRYVLQAGTLAEAEVTLTVPRGASTGSSSVQFVVSNGAGEMTRARAAVEVVDDGPRRGEQAWLVTPGVATVLGDTARARPVFGLDLEGPVANSVRLYGHLVQSAGLDAAHLGGLARDGRDRGDPRGPRAAGARGWRDVAAALRRDAGLGGTGPALVRRGPGAGLARRSEAPRGRRDVAVPALHARAGRQRRLRAGAGHAHGVWRAPLGGRHRVERRPVGRARHEPRVQPSGLVGVVGGATVRTHGVGHPRGGGALQSL